MRLLLIGDERRNRRIYVWGFTNDRYVVKQASTRAAVEGLIATEAFHAACVDWQMEDGASPEIVAMLRNRIPELPVVALISRAEQRPGQVMNAEGVAAFLVAPFSIEEIQALVQSHALAEPVMLSSKPVAPIRAEPEEPIAAPVLMPNDEIARRTLELASRAAKSNAAILILGETGTGKSGLARTIHRHSSLCRQPFVTVNCPCLNHELLESELFGHVRGAFTGAVQDTRGKVAAAEGGTLFLDEIGELPMTLQPKLLRLLQEKQYERVGETVPRNANVRVIAATNRDLRKSVGDGRFREDLYYRLNVIAIDVPPLRGRPSQIMGAAEDFLTRICVQLARSNPGFSLPARRMLEEYAWPGNLRELRNVIERAAILSQASVLGPDDFPALAVSEQRIRYEVGGNISLRELENAHIQMLIAKCASLEEVARILQIDKSTLYRKRKQIEAGIAEFAPTDESGPAMAAAMGS